MRAGPARIAIPPTCPPPGERSAGNERSGVPRSLTPGAASQPKRRRTARPQVMASRSSTIVVGGVASVLCALLLTLVIVKVFFVAYYVIPQNGMYPTLPSGSRLFATKHPYAAPSD